MNCSERDGQTLFEICTRLTMKHGLTLTRQAISQHLDVLESAGSVRTRRQGRYKLPLPRHEPAGGHCETMAESGPKGRPT